MADVHVRIYFIFEEIQLLMFVMLTTKSFLSNFLNTNKNKDSNMKFNCKIILDFYNFYNF